MTINIFVFKGNINGKTVMVRFFFCWVYDEQQFDYLRNEFDFWNVHGFMKTSCLLQSKCFTLTLQETHSINDSSHEPSKN